MSGRPIEDVKLYIGGDRVQNVKSYSIKYDLFKGAGSFEAEIDETLDIPIYNTPVQYAWHINGTRVMVGYIDRVERNYSKTNHTLSVSGRDMMSVLIDNHLLKFETLINKTIQQIINTVINDSFSVGTIQNLELQPSGKYDLVNETVSPTLFLPNISIQYTNQAMQVLNIVPAMQQVKKELGQTIFEFISDLITGSGLYMYNVPGTNTILIHNLNHTANTPVSYDRNGSVNTDLDYVVSNNSKLDINYNNVISATFTNDISNYYKLNRMYGQSNSEAEFNSNGVFGLTPNKLKADKIEKEYTGLTKFRVAQTHVINTEAWVKTRKYLVDNMSLQQSRHLFNIKYTVAGHTCDVGVSGSLAKKGTLPYYVNTIANVFDDMAGIQQRMLTYGVEFRSSKEAGQTTVLELCLPNIFLESPTGPGFPNIGG
jgi:hypothetical protein